MLKLFRLANWLFVRHVPLSPFLLEAVNRIMFGVVLPPATQVGPGVLFSYQGLGTVVHRETVIGARAVISTGVTQGGRAGRSGAPEIGEGALIGTGAKVLGPVRVGAHASVGANAVVLSDVPAYGVAVGVPAIVTRINRPDQILDYHAFD
jgi:serine O-acetyltransferase